MDGAGVSGKLFHDSRGTALRNLERVSVPLFTAMAMVELQFGGGSVRPPSAFFIASRPLASTDAARPWIFALPLRCTESNPGVDSGVGCTGTVIPRRPGLTSAPSPVPTTDPTANRPS